MRIPAFRVRTMMIVVGVCGALLGRWANFRQTADYHLRQRAKINVTDLEFCLVCTPAQGDRSNRDQVAREAAKPFLDFIDYHDAMHEKYVYAFWHPWLPVRLDPPSPPEPSKECVAPFRAEFLDPYLGEDSSANPNPPVASVAGRAEPPVP